MDWLRQRLGFAEKPTEGFYIPTSTIDVNYRFKAYYDYLNYPIGDEWIMNQLPYLYNNYMLYDASAFDGKIGMITSVGLYRNIFRVIDLNPRSAVPATLPSYVGDWTASGLPSLNTDESLPFVRLNRSANQYLTANRYCFPTMNILLQFRIPTLDHTVPLISAEDPDNYGTQFHVYANPGGTLTINSMFQGASVTNTVPNIVLSENTWYSLVVNGGGRSTTFLASLYSSEGILLQSGTTTQSGPAPIGTHTMINYKTYVGRANTTVANPYSFIHGSLDIYNVIVFGDFNLTQFQPFLTQKYMRITNPSATAFQSAITTTEALYNLCETLGILPSASVTTYTALRPLQASTFKVAEYDYFMGLFDEVQYILKAAILSNVSTLKSLSFLTADDRQYLDGLTLSNGYLLMITATYIRSIYPAVMAMATVTDQEKFILTVCREFALTFVSQNTARALPILTLQGIFVLLLFRYGKSALNADFTTMKAKIGSLYLPSSSLTDYATLMAKTEIQTLQDYAEYISLLAFLDGSVLRQVCQTLTAALTKYPNSLLLPEFQTASTYVPSQYPSFQQLYNVLKPMLNITNLNYFLYYKKLYSFFRLALKDSPFIKNTNSQSYRDYNAIMLSGIGGLGYLQEMDTYMDIGKYARVEDIPTNIQMWNNMFGRSASQFSSDQVNTIIGNSTGVKVVKPNNEFAYLELNGNAAANLGNAAISMSTDSPTGLTLISVLRVKNQEGSASAGTSVSASASTGILDIRDISNNTNRITHNLQNNTDSDAIWSATGLVPNTIRNKWYIRVQRFQNNVSSGACLSALYPLDAADASFQPRSETADAFVQVNSYINVNVLVGGLLNVATNTMSYAPCDFRELILIKRALTNAEIGTYVGELQKKYANSNIQAAFEAAKASFNAAYSSAQTVMDRLVVASITQRVIDGFSAMNSATDIPPWQLVEYTDQLTMASQDLKYLMSQMTIDVVQSVIQRFKAQYNFFSSYLPAEITNLGLQTTNADYTNIRTTYARSVNFAGMTNAELAQIQQDYQAATVRLANVLRTKLNKQLVDIQDLYGRLSPVVVTDTTSAAIAACANLPTSLAQVPAAPWSSATDETFAALRSVYAAFVTSVDVLAVLAAMGVLQYIGEFKTTYETLVPLVTTVKTDPSWPALDATYKRPETAATSVESFAAGTNMGALLTEYKDASLSLMNAVRSALYSALTTFKSTYSENQSMVSDTDLQTTVQNVDATLLTIGSSPLTAWTTVLRQTYTEIATAFMSETGWIARLQTIITNIYADVQLFKNSYETYRNYFAWNSDILTTLRPLYEQPQTQMTQAQLTSLTGVNFSSIRTTYRNGTLSMLNAIRSRLRTGLETFVYLFSNFMAIIDSQIYINLLNAGNALDINVIPTTPWTAIPNDTVLAQLSSMTTDFLTVNGYINTLNGLVISWNITQTVGLLQTFRSAWQGYDSDQIPTIAPNYTEMKAVADMINWTESNLSSMSLANVLALQTQVKTAYTYFLTYVVNTFETVQNDQLKDPSIFIRSSVEIQTDRTSLNTSFDNAKTVADEYLKPWVGYWPRLKVRAAAQTPKLALLTAMDTYNTMLNAYKPPLAANYTNDYITRITATIMPNINTYDSYTLNNYKKEYEENAVDKFMIDLYDATKFTILYPFNNKYMEVMNGISGQSGLPVPLPLVNWILPSLYYWPAPNFRYGFSMTASEIMALIDNYTKPTTGLSAILNKYEADCNLELTRRGTRSTLEKYAAFYLKYQEFNTGFTGTDCLALRRLHLRDNGTYTDAFINLDEAGILTLKGQIEQCSRELIAHMKNWFETSANTRFGTTFSVPYQPYGLADLNTEDGLNTAIYLMSNDLDTCINHYRDKIWLTIDVVQRVFDITPEATTLLNYSSDREASMMYNPSLQTFSAIDAKIAEYMAEGQRLLNICINATNTRKTTEYNPLVAAYGPFATTYSLGSLSTVKYGDQAGYDDCYYKNVTLKKLTGTRKTNAENLCKTNFPIKTGFPGTLTAFPATTFTTTFTTTAIAADVKNTNDTIGYLTNFVKGELLKYLRYLQATLGSSAVVQYSTINEDIATLLTNPVSSATLQAIITKYSLGPTQPDVSTLRANALAAITAFYNNLYLPSLPYMSSTSTAGVKSEITDATSLAAQIPTMTNTDQLTTIVSRYTTATSTLQPLALADMGSYIDALASVSTNMMSLGALTSLGSMTFSGLKTKSFSEQIAALSSFQTTFNTGWAGVSGRLSPFNQRFGAAQSQISATDQTTVSQRVSALTGFVSKYTATPTTYPSIADILVYKDALGAFVGFQQPLAILELQQQLQTARTTYKNLVDSVRTFMTLPEPQSTSYQTLSSASISSLIAPVSFTGPLSITPGSLLEAIDNYTGQFTAAMGTIRSTFGQHLTNLKDLYDAYTAFDATYSSFFDISSVSSDHQAAMGAISSDKAAADAATTSAVLLGILQKYYPNSTALATDVGFLFSDFIRFVKAQLKEYINTYDTRYDSLPAPLRTGVTDLSSFLSQVDPATYGSLGELVTLKTLITQLTGSTSVLQTALSNLSAVQPVLDILDIFKNLRQYVQQQPTGTTTKNAISLPATLLGVDVEADKSSVLLMTTAASMDAMRAKYAVLMKSLTLETLNYFNTVYKANSGLQSFFQTNVVEIFNAYYTFTDDVDAIIDNTMNQNDELARRYADYTQTILKAVVPALTVRDETEDYRVQTVALVDSMKQNLAAIKDVVGIVLPATGLSANPDEARQTVQSAVTRLTMIPIHSAYTTHNQDIVAAARTLATKVLTDFSELATQYAFAADRFSADVKAAIAAKEIDTIPTLTSVVALKNLVIKYRGLMTEVSALKPDTTQAIAAIDTFLENYGKVRGQIPTADLSVLGTPTSLQTAAAADKAFLGTARFPDAVGSILSKYTTHSVSLLRALRSEGSEIINQYVLKMGEYTTLQPYFLQSLRTALTNANTALKGLDSQNLDELIGTVKAYILFMANIDREVKRAETLKLMDQIQTILSAIQATNTGFIVPNYVPTADVMNQRRATLNMSEDSKQITDMYLDFQGIYNLMREEFNEFVLGKLEAYRTAYLEVKDLAIEHLISGNLRDLSMTLNMNKMTINGTLVNPTKASSNLCPSPARAPCPSPAPCPAPAPAPCPSPSPVTASKSGITSVYNPQAVLEILNKYVAGSKQLEEELSALRDKILFQKNKNEVLAAIRRFRLLLEIHRALGIYTAIMNMSDMDEEQLTAPSISMQTLTELRGKYGTYNADLNKSLTFAATSSIQEFKQRVETAKIPSDSLSTELRNGILGIPTDLERIAGGALEDIVLRDLVLKYNRLMTQFVLYIPTLNDLDRLRAETLMMIDNFAISLESAKTYGLDLTDALLASQPEADRRIVIASTSIEQVSEFRGTYILNLYEINSRFEEAETTVAALVAKGRADALARITQFEQELVGTTLNIEIIPQIKEARDKATAYKAMVAAAATSVASLQTITQLYVDAIDVLQQRTTQVGKNDIAVKRQEAISYMEQFSRFFQDNSATLQQLPASVREGVLAVSTDLQTAQKSAVTMLELTDLITKYKGLATTLQNVLQAQKTSVSQAVILAIRRYKGVLGEAAPARDNISPSLLMPSTAIQTDLDMVQGGKMTSQALTEMKTRYDDLTRDLKDAMPAVCNILGTVQIVKRQILNLIGQLNTLVLANSNKISRANPTIQSRIRAIPVDVAYIGQPDVPLSELQDLRTSYATTVRDLQRFLDLQKGSVSSSFPNLNSVQMAFRTLYNTVNLNRLNPKARDFVDKLYEVQANAIVVRNTSEAIAAYTNGLNVLASILPAAETTATSGDVGPFRQLLALFQSEYALRDLSRAISNDRMYLSNLLTSITPDLKTRTDFTEDQLNSYTNTYRQGIQILRLYPLK